ncbi:hypothetical protein CN918_27390 [Priestia megaterium]|nr:hypothetical protein CN918_27390 [Priestia megaterium]
MGSKKIKGKQVMEHHPLPVEVNEQIQKEKNSNVFKRHNNSLFKKKIPYEEKTNQNKISIKLEQVPASTKSTKKASAKYYQRIEEVAGRAVDDILLENMQLKNRNIQAGEQILSLNNQINSALETLVQLLDVELNLNPEIAIPIADEFYVNKKNETAHNQLNNIVSVSQALRKIRYYYHPSIEDWMETVEISKRHMKVAQEEAEHFKEKWSTAQKEVEELKTQKRQRDEQEQQRLRKMEAKGITIRVNAQQKTNLQTVPVTEVQPGNNQNSEVDVSSELEYPIIEAYESQEHTEAPELVLSKEFREPEEIYVTPSYRVEKTAAKTINDMTYEGELGKREKVNTSIQANDTDNLLTTIKKPKYLHLLDSHGYQYTPSPNPHFDVMIQTKNEKVPLIYIDYLIEDANSFGEIMEGTDNVYILFEKQEHLKQGNYKFTSWLFKSRERRKSVKFSLTTLDDLQSRGMAELDGLQGGA